MFNELFEDDPFDFDMDDKAQAGEVITWTIDLIDELGAHEFEKAEELAAQVFSKGPDAVWVSCLTIAAATQRFLLLEKGLTEVPGGAFTVVVPPVRPNEDKELMQARQFAAQFVAAYMNEDSDICQALFTALMQSHDMDAIHGAHTAMLEQAHQMMHRAADADPSAFESVPDPFKSSDN